MVVARDPPGYISEIYHVLTDRNQQATPVVLAGNDVLNAVGRASIERRSLSSMDVSDSGSEKAQYLLSFSLGPVQPFIASARSVRDLWTGSFLLSWLTFQAMQPLRERYGPGAFVMPSLDGNPLLERPKAPGLERPSACLPNRFLAVITDDSGGTKARTLASECESSCRSAWKRICDAVREGLAKHAAALDPDWDRLWDAQVDGFFEIRTAALPFGACDEAALRRLLGSSFEVSQSRPHNLWWGRLQLAARLMEAKRVPGHIPVYPVENDVPQKCTLLGTYEQMGPAGFAESRSFWRSMARPEHAWAGTQVRGNEGLCAISLVKRFAWPALLSPELGLRARAGHYPDTATVAAAQWLRDREGAPAIDPEEERDAHGDWSGLWLHWHDRTGPQDGRDSDDSPQDPVPTVDQWNRIRKKRLVQKQPPAYLAVLMLDGDRLGRWLRGENTPEAGPELNTAISRALAQFSLKAAPPIVKDRDGILVYSGGDDVLALLPTREALRCARELNEAFCRVWKEDVGSFGGPRPSTSAGIVVIHYKEDLRFALARARAAEQGAKDAGRDLLTVAICRRSGEHSSAVIPWSRVERLEGWVEKFRAGASDRWLYTLRAETPALRGRELPWEAVEAEVRRVAGRVEDQKRRIDPDEALKFLRDYRDFVQLKRRGDGEEPDLLEAFITLAQSASFLARGRD